MDCLFGIVGDGFTLVAADTSACQSIIRMKQGEDKILEASNGKMLLVSWAAAPPLECVWAGGCVELMGGQPTLGQPELGPKPAAAS